MPKLIAIHEIHRPGKNGQPEVIAPGKSFSATKEEAEQLVDVFGAAQLAGSDAGAEDGGDDNQGGEKPLADMTAKELADKAAALQIEVPKGANKAAVAELIQAKLDADKDMI